jgi:hypothetical protein
MLIASFAKSVRDLSDEDNMDGSDEEEFAKMKEGGRVTLADKSGSSLPIPIQIESSMQRRSPTAFSFESFRGNLGKSRAQK